jgi:hypothetical protein
MSSFSYNKSQNSGSSNNGSSNNGTHPAVASNSIMNNQQSVVSADKSQIIVSPVKEQPINHIQLPNRQVSSVTNLPIAEIIVPNGMSIVGNSIGNNQSFSINAIANELRSKGDPYMKIDDDYSCVREFFKQKPKTVEFEGIDIDAKVYPLMSAFVNDIYTRMRTLFDLLSTEFKSAIEAFKIVMADIKTKDPVLIDYVADDSAIGFQDFFSTDFDSVNSQFMAGKLFGLLEEADFKKYFGMMSAIINGTSFDPTNLSEKLKANYELFLRLLPDSQKVIVNHLTGLLMLYGRCLVVRKGGISIHNKMVGLCTYFKKMPINDLFAVFGSKPSNYPLAVY